MSNIELNHINDEKIDNKLKYIFKDKFEFVKSHFAEILTILSMMVSVGIAFINCLSYVYQSSYLSYWNIDLSLVKFDSNFSFYTSITLIISIIILYLSNIILIHMFTVALESGVIWTLKKYWKNLLLSMIVFLVGSYIICCAIFSKDLVWEYTSFIFILFRSLFMFAIIIFFYFIVGLMVHKKLNSKKQNQCIANNKLTVMISLLIAMLFIAISLFLFFFAFGKSAAEAKQEFYVYQEITTVNNSDGSIREIENIYVMIYSDGKSAVFEEAYYEGQNTDNPKEVYTVPKIRILTDKQKFMSLDDISLELKIFNRRTETELNDIFER